MSSKNFLYDVFVIGGGSGGLAASKAAGALNVKVGLANFVRPSPKGTSWGLGGTCVNVGCIPKKLMHYAAQLGLLRSDQAECGWTVSQGSQHNWKKMIEGITTHIKKLNGIHETLLKNNNVEYFNCEASLKDKHTICLTDAHGNQKEVTARYIIISGGGRPSYLDLPNAKELCITSDDVFWMEEDPGRTLVVGSGYIGLECAGFLRGLNKEVDVIYRSKPLAKFDRDMVNRITDDMMSIGVNFMKGNIQSLEKEGDKIKVQSKITIEENEEEITDYYDTVLMAIGRTPENEVIGLKNIGMELDQRGKAKVNEQCQSSIDNIFVIGDAKNKGMELTPVAIKEGRMVIEGLFTNTWKPINYNTVPTTIFTPLEYGCVGYTEEQAIDEFGEDNIDVYHTGFKPLEWTFLKSSPTDNCYVKVIVIKESKKILGIHFTGPNAGEVIQSYAIAVRLGLTLDALQDTVGIHPTTAEEIVTLETTKRENPVAMKTGC